MLPLSETFIYAPTALPVKQLTLASVTYLDFIEGIHSTTGKAVGISRPWASDTCEWM